MREMILTVHSIIYLPSCHSKPVWNTTVDTLRNVEVFLCVRRMKVNGHQNGLVTNFPPGTNSSVVPPYQWS